MTTREEAIKFESLIPYTQLGVFNIKCPHDVNEKSSDYMLRRTQKSLKWILTLMWP